MQISRLLPIAAVVFTTIFISIAWVRPAHATETPIWQLDPQITALLAPSPVESTLLPLLPASAASLPRSGHIEFSPRQLLTSLANRLRDIRYKRGGKEPSTGFDCSGFVHYVYRQGIGADLPISSAAQYNAGHKINRNDLRSGDLVFFRTAGKRISHVGIYLDEGRFIHAPSAGKSVSVSSLSEPYWAKRFAGAKRPEILARNEAADHRNHG
jgi:cell wall-associated NlpC family hydrolase